MKIDDYEIERLTVYKFLGILIHENLTWDAHIAYVNQKISKNLGILYKTRHVLGRNSMIQLYFSFISSYLSYGNIVWGSTYKTNLKPLLLKQKHASRIIFFEGKFTHSEPLFTEMKALNIYQLNPTYFFISKCLLIQTIVCDVCEHEPMIFVNLL